METLFAYLFLLGRLLFGGFFIYNGINHVRDAGYLAQYAESKNVPYPDEAVLASGILIILGGAGVVTGILPHIALVLIMLFLIPVSIMMHGFWRLEDEERQAEQIAFLKNMALLGATLALLSVPQPWDFSIPLS